MAKKRFKRNILIIFIIIAIIAAGIIIYVVRTNQKKSNMATYNPESNSIKRGGGADNQGGGIVDNNQSGKAGSQASSSSSSSSAAGIKSASGVITLTSPSSGATIGSGTNVSGAGDGLSQVQYRIENAEGIQLALGQLSVVNGAFSGTISGLQASGGSGTLEIYDYKNGNGPEENGVTINVNFQ